MPDHNEILNMLNRNVSNLTEEVISMKTSIAAIEDNTEISVMNGGVFEVKMKTNTLLKHMYEQTKQGGIIDKKFAECKDSHTAQRKFGNFNKSMGTFIETIRIAGTIALFILVVLSFLRGSQRDEKLLEMDKKLNLIEKIAK